jgi:DNA-binding response OmpR family regulator
MIENEKKSLQALMEQHNVAGFNLDELEMRLENLRVVPYDIAEKNLILPVSVTANRITLVMADPTNDQIKEEIEFVTGKQVVANVAEPEQLTAAIKDCYAAHRAGEKVYRGKNAIKINISVSSGSGEGNSDIEVRVNTPEFAPRLSSIPPNSPTASQPAEADTTAENSRKKILVVDDEEEILILISKVLSAEGHQIITTARGLDAIKKIQSEKLDLVILDAMLPEIHGFDICKQIKEDDNYKHLPVIMISAIYRGWRYAKDLKESYGVDDFIEKPFNIEELLKTVDKHCNKECTDQPGSSPDISENAKKTLVSCMKMYREGNIDEAIARLSEAVKNDSTNFDLHYNLALLLGKKGFAHQAILRLETALGLNPDSFAALKNLAVLYQKTAFKLKAIETWERTLDACPDKKTRDGIKRHLVDLL